MILYSHKVGQWTDPFTLPQTKTECISYARGKWPWGGEWKTCNGWKTQSRHMEVEAFFDVNGPDDVSEDIKSAIKECILLAVATAGFIGAATDGIFAAEAAQDAFYECLKHKYDQELDKFSISFRTASGWTNWA